MIASNSQSLLDIALQHTGTADTAIYIALSNGLSLTADLLSGQALAIPDLRGNRAMAQYYTVNHIMPATGDTADGETAIPAYGGINYMGIEIDFKVS